MKSINNCCRSIDLAILWSPDSNTHWEKTSFDIYIYIYISCMKIAELYNPIWLLPSLLFYTANLSASQVCPSVVWPKLIKKVGLFYI